MRRKGIGAVALGGVLLIAAVTGFIIVPEHKPGTTPSATVKPVNANNLAANSYCPGGDPTLVVPRDFQCPGPPRKIGLSHTAYDGLRIATWALAILGVLTVVTGLIRYARPGSER